MNNQIPWQDKFAAMFGRKLSDEEIAAWEDVLDDAFPRKGTDAGWAGSELKAALTKWAESRRKEGLAGRGAEPTAMSAKTLMIHARWQARPEDRQAAEVFECALCSEEGLIEFWPKLGADVDRLRDLSAWRVTIPCDCPRGRKAVAEVREYTTWAQRDPVGFLNARQLAVRQNRSADAKAKQRDTDAGPGWMDRIVGMVAKQEGVSR